MEIPGLRCVRLPRRLPLDSRSLRRILVTGPKAAVARLGGGGSASVTQKPRV